ncbi:conserved Plasmodium protein, unknown function [Plasmodium malariae]|uniref:Uncharacterized protein n=1 Tax=Plasmodium malariae TaxID=5858 RepID=A0A1D3PCD6_PLAMA|nr:conserved Plasmodium protein, unknown function [Plasmodium malariae]SCN12957.1 conserved Plasmodium protein, unknown function [Plasmodium malariae]
MNNSDEEKNVKGGVAQVPSPSSVSSDNSSGSYYKNKFRFKKNSIEIKKKSLLKNKLKSDDMQTIIKKVPTRSNTKNKTIQDMGEIFCLVNNKENKQKENEQMNEKTEIKSVRCNKTKGVKNHKKSVLFLKGKPVQKDSKNKVNIGEQQLGEEKYGKTDSEEETEEKHTDHGQVPNNDNGVNVEETHNDETPPNNRLHKKHKQKNEKREDKNVSMNSDKNKTYGTTYIKYEKEKKKQQIISKDGKKCIQNSLHNSNENIKVLNSSNEVVKSNEKPRILMINEKQTNRQIIKKELSQSSNYVSPLELIKKHGRLNNNNNCKNNNINCKNNNNNCKNNNNNCKNNNNNCKNNNNNCNNNNENNNNNNVLNYFINRIEEIFLSNSQEIENIRNDFSSLKKDLNNISTLMNMGHKAVASLK